MPDYHAISRETSNEVDHVIRRYISDSDPATAELPTKRLGRPRLRDVSIRLGYEVSGGKNWREVVPLCAAFELENCSSYVINWIFDQKGGPKSRQEVNNLIIAGMQLRELSQLVLIDNKLEHLAFTINDIQRDGYRGQYTDLNTLIAENVRDFPSLESFLQAYDERCKNLSGVFHGYCLQSGSVLANNLQPTLYTCGVLFGSGLQASNDLGDFTPPTEDAVVIEKPYSDQFSDLRQGKLTLPVYLLLTRGSEEDKRNIASKIGKITFTESDCSDVVSRLFSTDSFDECYQRLLSKKKLAKRTLYNTFPRSDARDLIAQMFSSIVCNKFITNLRKAQQVTT